VEVRGGIRHDVVQRFEVRAAEPVGFDAADQSQAAFYAGFDGFAGLIAMGIVIFCLVTLGRS